jgi:hypothetical protein
MFLELDNLQLQKAMRKAEKPSRKEVKEQASFSAHNHVHLLGRALNIR